MYHGLTNQYLYSAYKIDATFRDDIGNPRVGSGTCFFVRNKAGKLCLVTNRHVLDYAYKKSDPQAAKFLLREIRVSGKRGAGPDNLPVGDVSFVVAPIVRFSLNQENDIACLTELTVIGNDVTIDYFIPYEFIATAEEFNSALQICDFLAFPGFPEWHDSTAKRPIMRTGTLSSDPRYDYAYRNEVRGACAAYEAFSYSGSSGSPVFSLQKGLRPGNGLSFPGFRELRFVGINAGHLKVIEHSDIPDGELKRTSHSGISYFYKSTAILDIVDT